MPDQTHSVFSPVAMGYVDLTSEQETIRERFKAHAAQLFQGAEWTRAREALQATGLSWPQVHETLTDAVQELIENGWESYH
jgi:hypothetical protein